MAVCLLGNPHLYSLCLLGEGHPYGPVSARIQTAIRPCLLGEGHPYGPLSEHLYDKLDSCFFFHERKNTFHLRHASVCQVGIFFQFWIFNLVHSNEQGFLSQIFHSCIEIMSVKYDSVMHLHLFWVMYGNKVET